ncbi:hypothetical protein BV898_07019 [Hypsibius exemplaris]|uniref:Uncharacterized protein n=1 Tax=Hypsibius exemplaris TaxID=2072580 RepID=A0A1W0WUZ2_HYPEX|nr:hypothetical protein BV898_07019 [Hypsibius exemplaris]
MIASFYSKCLCALVVVQFLAVANGRSTLADKKRSVEAVEAPSERQFGLFGLGLGGLGLGYGLGGYGLGFGGLGYGGLGLGLGYGGLGLGGLGFWDENGDKLSRVPAGKMKKASKNRKKLYMKLNDDDKGYVAGSGANGIDDEDSVFLVIRGANDKKKQA